MKEKNPSLEEIEKIMQESKIESNNWIKEIVNKSNEIETTINDSDSPFDIFDDKMSPWPLAKELKYTIEIITCIVSKLSKKAVPENRRNETSQKIISERLEKEEWLNEFIERHAPELKTMWHEIIKLFVWLSKNNKWFCCGVEFLLHFDWLLRKKYFEGNKELMDETKIWDHFTEIEDNEEEFEWIDLNKIKLSENIIKEFLIECHRLFPKSTEKVDQLIADPKFITSIKKETLKELKEQHDVKYILMENYPTDPKDKANLILASLKCLIADTKNYRDSEIYRKYFYKQLLISLYEHCENEHIRNENNEKRIKKEEENKLKKQKEKEEHEKQLAISEAKRKKQEEENQRTERQNIENACEWIILKINNKKNRKAINDYIKRIIKNKKPLKVIDAMDTYWITNFPQETLNKLQELGAITIDERRDEEKWINIENKNHNQNSTKEIRIDTNHQKEERSKKEENTERDEGEKEESIFCKLKNRAKKNQIRIENEEYISLFLTILKNKDENIWQSIEETLKSQKLKTLSKNGEGEQYLPIKDSPWRLLLSKENWVLTLRGIYHKDKYFK